MRRHALRDDQWDRIKDFISTIRLRPRSKLRALKKAVDPNPVERSSVVGASLICAGRCMPISVQELREGAVHPYGAAHPGPAR